MGPMEHTSIQGNKFALTCVDDFSRRTWIYFLKTKDQVLNFFTEFHAFVEKQFDSKLKILKIDNGKEYVNNIFSTYLKLHGIEYKLIIPYTP